MKKGELLPFLLFQLTYCTVSFQIGLYLEVLRLDRGHRVCFTLLGRICLSNRLHLLEKKIERWTL